jgi:hypothetical protein
VPPLRIKPFGMEPVTQPPMLLLDFTVISVFSEIK